jgi:hypothetical protein
MQQIDFNQLIKDIISSAKLETNAQLNQPKIITGNNKSIATVKLEITITNHSTEECRQIAKSSKRLVVLTIRDHVEKV